MVAKILFDTPMADKTPAPEGPAFILSDAAAARIKDILKTKADNVFLRITVKGGGCNGYTYAFTLEEEEKETDVEITHPEYATARVRLDPSSIGLLYGSTLDYIESLEASQFVVKNPNAKSQCGCGTSFGV